MRRRNAGLGEYLLPAACVRRLCCNWASASAAQEAQLFRWTSKARRSDSGSSPSTYASTLPRQESHAMVCPFLVRHLARGVSLLLQRLAQGFPRPCQSRHHRADGDGNDVRNLLVRHFFHLAQQEDLAIDHRQLLDRVLHQLLVDAVDED